jgi:hypothetical protein
MEANEICKNTFLGWHQWNSYEVLGLFQKVSDDTWWFCGPGEGMSFRVDLSQSRMAKWNELNDILDWDYSDVEKYREEFNAGDHGIKILKADDPELLAE